MSSTASAASASSSSAAGVGSSPSLPSSAKFFWLDLEMTGLDESVDRILEVAVIVTDSAWQPLARYHSVVRQPADSLAGMSAFVRQMHTTTGLLQRLETEGKAEATVEAELLQLVSSVYAEGEQVLLSGNSVHVDRRFIRRYWPQLDARLHYRILDVSSWKEVFASLYDTWWDKKRRHAAMEDVEESIAELRYYLSFLDTDKLRRQGGKGSAA